MHLLDASAWESSLFSVAADFNMEHLLQELPGPSGSSGLGDYASMMSQGSGIDLSIEEDSYSPPSLAPVFWSSPKYNHGTATEHGDSVMVSGVHRLAVVSGGTAASNGSGRPPDGDSSGDPQPPRSTNADSPKCKGPGRR